MARSLWLLPAAILAAALFTGKASAEKEAETVASYTAQVVRPGVYNRVLIKARSEGDSEYRRDIRVEIYDAAGRELLLTIAPETDAGFNPRLAFADFADLGTQQIFLGIDNGGSGAFGYYYVYDASAGKARTLFDYERFGAENRFSGRYLDGYRAEVVSEEDGTRFGIDLSARDETYKDGLYEADGTLRQPAPVVEISGVNTVFPFFNSSVNQYQLSVYQRVTGLASYDALGYVISQLRYEDGAFKTYFRLLGVYGTDRKEGAQ